MRSAAPTTYSFSDEHYRIEFKDATLEYPCTVENIVVHEGYSINFEWFMQEKTVWKWRSLKPEQKQSKKNKNSRKKQPRKLKPNNARKPTNKQKKHMKQTNARLSKEAEDVKQTACKKTRSVQVKKAAPTVNKKMKLMSVNKFKALEFKMRLNITTTEKERDTYKEQCVLRKLKRFLG